MGRRCLACDHPDRATIDRALLLEGIPVRTLAGTHGLSSGGLQRHKDMHLGGLQRRIAEENRSNVAATVARSVTQDIQALRAKADDLGRKAELGGDLRTALQAVRELTRLVELQERLALEARQGQASDIAAHPAWIRLRTALLDAIRPYPECYPVVIAAMARVLGEVSPDLPPALP